MIRLFRETIELLLFNVMGLLGIALIPVALVYTIIKRAWKNATHDSSRIW